MTDKAEKQPADDVNEVRSLEIVPRFPEGQHAVFSNFVVVQNDGHDFHICFFEIQPPVVVGDEEVKRRYFETHESIDAHCVSRLVMSPSRIPNLIEALQSQYEKMQRLADEPDND